MMKKRVVALVGDFYHPKEVAISALNKALLNLPEVELEYASENELLEKLETQPDAVILFKLNKLNPQDEHVITWMDEELAATVSDYVDAGGGWFAWHSGIASFQNVQTYTEMIKGYFEHHPAPKDITYKPVSGSSIVENVEEFTIFDEHYFVVCEEEKTNIFLTSESEDGASIAGWTHEYGKGSVVCLTPSHFEEGTTHPAVIDMLVNGLKVVCKM
ncbi:ThuA domain-containing protein [Lederbergia graminis]|uniref:ThuA domain-containing protein n=2 Tax=Lederbergia graminis TaxID=735518 RepID=A0ABW0LM19_9BACI